MKHKSLLPSAVALLSLVALVLVTGVAPAAADPGRGADILCYLWANNASPTINAPYVPSNIYSYNSVGRAQAITVTRTAVGQYTVTCQGVGGGALFSSTGEAAGEESRGQTNEAVQRQAEERAAAGDAAEASGSWGSGGHVQVTAYGSEDADQCKVASWATGGRDFTAFVRCYNHAGGLADSRFDLLFVW
jgi:hypothetical protein